MGCDIHAYKEKLVNGKWVTADHGWCDEYSEGTLDVPYENRFTDRNYDLFGLLCKGVRRNFDFANPARGLPADMCPEVAAVSTRWGDDGHHYSYLYLHELKEMQARQAAGLIEISGFKDPADLARLQASIDSEGPTDWNLLYPYWRSGPGVPFSVSVPATFAADIAPLIALFDGIDGENHRLVFWFDN